MLDRGVFEADRVVDRDVTGNDVTGNDITGSHRKWDVTGSHRKWLYRKGRSGKCKGDNFPRLFFSPGFCRVFSSETPWGLLGNCWEFSIGHSIFPAVFKTISTNENLGKSTNEMAWSPFQLANHGSPYRSNESVRTIYFWPFVESLSFVQLI